ncbi:hypothetical protein ZWY2020_049719 [Hordeum vulgare]|nr:hypothetical protein ZWY2020_049719 [Hordeum vulgare]
MAPLVSATAASQPLALAQWLAQPVSSTPPCRDEVVDRVLDVISTTPGKLVPGAPQCIGRCDLGCNCQHSAVSLMN